MTHQDNEPEVNPGLWSWMALMSLVGMCWTIIKLALRYPEIHPVQALSLVMFILCFIASIWKVTRS